MRMFEYFVYLNIYYIYIYICMYIYIYIYINQDHKNCLGAVQIKNKINRLEKDKIDADSYKED